MSGRERKVMADRAVAYEAGAFREIEWPEWAFGDITDPNSNFVLVDGSHDIVEGFTFPSVWVHQTAEGWHVVIGASEDYPMANVFVMNVEDWVPFLANYLAPLLATGKQDAILAQNIRLTNAFIAWVRHGEGDHLDRLSGNSDIDERLDHERRLRWQRELRDK